MRTGDRQLAVDANVILRYVVHDDEALYAKAAAVFQAMEEGRVTLLCDAVILGEVVWVLTSYYTISRNDIAQGLKPLLKADGFIMSDKERYIQALDLYAGSIPHFGDACACAAAIEKCDGKLLSFDRKLSAVKGISRSESV